jgi:SNF2 family DNA or RNA helicase
MQVYWLRLIIDEGHVMGNKQSNQANLAANLLCERKWACTGTPTPGNHLAPSYPL